MARRKAEQELAVNFGQAAQKLREVHAVVRPAAVGVYVLAQKGNILIPLGNKLARFLDHVFRAAAALPPAHIRDDAVGAEIVAAGHDGQPRLDIALPADGQPLGDDAGLIRRLKEAAAPGEHFLKQLREAPESLGTEDEVDVPVGAAERVRDVLLLHHAAAHGDNLVRFRAFCMHKRADDAENALFRVLAHGAGVDDDDVGLSLRLREGVAHGREHAADFFAVGFVLLAAVRVHKRKRRSRHRLGHTAHPLHGASLAFKLLLGKFNGGFLHKALLKG